MLFALPRSATDATVPPPLRGKYRAFAERDSAGIRCGAFRATALAADFSVELQYGCRQLITAGPISYVNTAGIHSLACAKLSPALTGAAGLCGVEPET